LKITDLVNNNVYFSNGFLITNYQSDLTTRFDYTNSTKIYGISYDLVPYTQSVRLAGCYDYTPTNKRDVKQYVTSQGKQVNYRSITTFLRQYNIDSLDYFVNDRLEVLFSHGVIYCNGQRVVVSDYSVDERKGLSNLLNGEFTINPQGQTFTFAYQLYEGLEVVSLLPLNGGVYTETSLNTATTNGENITLTFNKDIEITSDITAKLYYDGSLENTISVSNITALTNVLTLDFSAIFPLSIGVFSIVIEPSTITSGADSFIGFAYNEWVFTVVDGEFSSTDFDTDEFLTN
jgi:hypothetical protein